ncbi:phospholipid scramblase 2-like [Penaeus vannamei]|uniref:phospholipid scramblase 2-like n=1 Tax=Penaeus vannamei TaxID=6689 RepID=UPI00387F9BFE
MSQPGNMGYGQQPPYPAPGPYPPAGGYPQPGPYPPPGGYQPPVGSYPQPYPGQYPTPQQPVAGYMGPAYPPGSIPQGGYGPPRGPQPGQPGAWMPAPQVPNCPPGLEYLTQIDQIIVQQQVELLEAFTGFETSNKYKVKNSLGQQMYFAAEDTDCCTRQCCGPMRPFDMKIMDNSQNEVIHLNRPLACDSCLFPCCLQSIEVTSPPGTVIGSIHQEWSILAPKFTVRNASDDVILRIEGPFCTYSICGDVEFQVLSPDGSTQVGKISKQWTGLAKEAFTDADNFGITFPIDLDVKMKATLLGAVFLIDFMFFEKKGNKENDSVGML